MESILQKLFESFKLSKIDCIREYVKDFAMEITNCIFSRNYTDLKKLYEGCALIRDEIEFSCTINKTVEYYYGYMFAYESIARNLFYKESTDIEIEKTVKNNVRLWEIIKYLANNNHASHKKLADGLGVSPNNLTNFFNNADHFKKLNIIDIQRIGRNRIYSLTKRGLEFYKQQINVEEKLYSKENIIDILDVIFKSEISHNQIRNYINVLDDDLLMTIILRKLELLLGKRETNYPNKSIAQPQYQLDENEWGQALCA